MAGFEQDAPHRQVRITPRGEAAGGNGEVQRTVTPVDDGLVVWLEREGTPQANDAIILERLSLAVRIRHGRSRHPSEHRRELGLLLDGSVAADERCTAAAGLGLLPTLCYRVVVAPLFAVWDKHPRGPEDVVPTAFGPLHAVVVAESVRAVEGSPTGIGASAPPEHLHRSFRSAVAALRLCDPPGVGSVSADDFGGLIPLIADQLDDGSLTDVAGLETLAAHPWAAPTLDAIVRTSSVRHAARVLGIHHSTMQTRLDTVTETLGWDPLDGLGRTRLGIAYLTWRLRHSRVLDLPAPRYD
ncbi:helix-turn-helix domain-containing protein [Nakamurella alba]|uniref:helix-turn-helix domain-containing protein n=1 Tax=Nakamurella alba TaxID=2665158 RepID=UPI002AC369AF|nr:helix-turn-helix domain-containing protein [Nakamurella alba]